MKQLLLLSLLILPLISGCGKKTKEDELPSKINHELLDEESIATNALISAIKAQDISKVRELLLHGDRADLNAFVDKEQTILTYGLIHNETIALMILGQGRVDINLKNKKGETPLMLAAFHGHNSAVQSLISLRELKINEVDPENNNALHYAIKGRHTGISLVLINEKIDYKLKNNFGIDALSMSMENQLETVVAVLRALIHTNSDMPDDIQTAYYLKFSKHHELKFILESRPNLIVQIKKLNPVHLVLSRLDKERNQILELISQFGADMNEVAQYGETPLLYAIKHLDLATIELLVNLGADVNMVDDLGVSPLILAIQNKNTEVAKFLLTQNAFTKYQYFDKDNKKVKVSACDWAKKTDNKELRKLMNCGLYALWNLF